MFRTRRSHRLLFIGILLLGFALRVYRLGVDSLWYDETVSALLARKSLAEMWAHTVRDIHPPLYYALLHFWRLLAGGSEYSLAFLSVWFSVGGVAMVGYLGRRLFGARVGLLAALLMAVNPFSIWYAQEVRMYALGVFLTLLLLKFVLDFLEDSRDGDDGPRTTGGGGQSSIVHRLQRCDFHSLAGYAITAALLLWTLYYTAFTLIALNLFVIPWLWFKARRKLWPWLGAQVAAIILYLPWLPHALQQALHPPVPPWRQPIGLGALLLTIAREGVTALTLGQSIDAGRWWPLGLLALGVAALAFRTQDDLTQRRKGAKGKLYSVGGKLENPWAAGLLWTLLLGPVALIALVSLALTPLYHVRYLNLYSGTFPILLAAGLVTLARFGSRQYSVSSKQYSVSSSQQSKAASSGRFKQDFGFFLAGAFLFLLLAGAAISLRNYHTRRFEYEAADDLRGAMTAIDDHLGPRDAVLIDAGYLYPAFLNYWPDAIGWMGRLSEYPPEAAGEGPAVALAGFVDGDPDIGWGDPASDFYAISRAETVARLQQLFEDHNTVWLLRGYDTVNDPEGVIRAWLEAHGELIYDQVFPGLTYVRVQGWRTAPVRDGLPLQPPRHPLTADFEDGIRLIGYDISPDAPQPDRTLRLTLYWQAQATPSRSYKAFVHWLTADWQMIAQDDELPGYGALPTDAWQPGQIVESNFVLPPPAGLAPGDYRLVTGFYDAETGAGLALTNGESQVTLWDGR